MCRDDHRRDRGRRRASRRRVVDRRNLRDEVVGAAWVRGRFASGPSDLYLRFIVATLTSAPGQARAGAALGRRRADPGAHLRAAHLYHTQLSHTQLRARARPASHHSLHANAGWPGDASGHDAAQAPAQSPAGDWQAARRWPLASHITGPCTKASCASTSCDPRRRAAPCDRSRHGLAGEQPIHGMAVGSDGVQLGQVLSGPCP